MRADHQNQHTFLITNVTLLLSSENIKKKKNKRRLRLKKGTKLNAWGRSKKREKSTAFYKGSFIDSTDSVTS